MSLWLYLLAKFMLRGMDSNILFTSKVLSYFRFSKNLPTDKALLSFIFTSAISFSLSFILTLKSGARSNWHFVCGAVGTPFRLTFCTGSISLLLPSSYRSSSCAFYPLILAGAWNEVRQPSLIGIYRTVATKGYLTLRWNETFFLYI